MKSLAGQDARLPRDLKVDWELCRRYALSLPVSTVICGMQTREEVRGMVRIARGFTPLTAPDVERLLGVAKGPAPDGHIEEYKDPKGFYGCSYQDAVLKAKAKAKTPAAGPRGRGGLACLEAPGGVVSPGCSSRSL